MNVVDRFDLVIVVWVLIAIFVHQCFKRGGRS